MLKQKLEDELYEFERIKKIPTFMKKLEKLRTVDESELSSDEESDACRMMAEVDGLKKVLKDTEEAVEGYKEKEKELTRSNNALNDQVAYLQKSLKVSIFFILTFFPRFFYNVLFDYNHIFRYLGMLISKFIFSYLIS